MKTIIAISLIAVSTAAYAQQCTTIRSGNAAFTNCSDGSSAVDIYRGNQTYTTVQPGLPPPPPLPGDLMQVDPYTGMLR